MSEARILIADDHPILGDSLAALLDGQPDMKVVGVARDGAEALEKIEELAPDIVIIDISMPRRGGLEVVELVHRKNPEIAFLVFTMHKEKSYLRSAIAAGAIGYVVKSAPSDQIIVAIRELKAGRTFINVPLPEGELDEILLAGTTARTASQSKLTGRQLDVLRLVAEGYTNTEIGDMLGLSKKTIDTYRTRIMVKLGLTDRVELVRYALETGLLRPGDSLQGKT